jgi:serine/threonine-protein kinase
MDAEVSMTQTSLVMGSPLYMSPEQLRSSKDVDARADIWSIGVILYEVLTGCVPFEGATVAEVVTQILAMDPISPTKRCAGLPAEIEAAIFKCLKKDRLDRYQSVEELAAVLAPFATYRESYAPRDALTYPSARNVTPASVTPRGGGTTPLVEAAPTRTSWEQANVTTLSKRWKMIVLAALTILALGVIAGKLLAPAKLPPSVIAGPSTPSTSNASVMASALTQRPSEPAPALAVMPTDPTRVDSSRTNAERSATKKRNVAAVAPISSKVESTVVPSASTRTLPQSHPFDDRK